MAESPTIEELAAEVARLKTQPERIIVVPREKTVRKFSGRTSDIESFKLDLDTLWESRQLNKKEKLETIFSNITETIRDEVRCYPKDVQEDPDRLLAALEVSYGDKRSVSQLLSSFYSIRQSDGESVREFSHRLKRNFDHLVKTQRQHDVRPLDETFLRDHFIEQLNGQISRKRLRELALEKKDVTFYDVRDIAIRWAEDEEGPAREVHSQAALSSPALYEKLLNKLEQLEKRLGSLEMPGHNPRSKFPFTPDGQPICLRCKKPGHIARKCPENP